MAGVTTEKTTTGLEVTVTTKGVDEAKAEMRELRNHAERAGVRRGAGGLLVGVGGASADALAGGTLTVE